MQKRGQVAVFVIIGLVILLAFVFIFIGKDTIIKEKKQAVNKQEFLTTELESIKKEVNKCIITEGTATLDKIIENGGILGAKDILVDNGRTITILCKKHKEDKKCYNEVPQKEEIIKQLNNKIKQDFLSCLNLEYYGKNYQLIKPTQSQVTISGIIEDKSVTIDVIYPLKLKLEEVTLTEEKFYERFDIPLGDYLNIANQISGKEATTGEFNAISFSIANLYYSIEKQTKDRHNGAEYSLYNIYYIYKKIDRSERFIFATEKNEAL